MVWFRRIKKFEEMLIEEINGLGIKNLQVKALNLLNGFYVNLEYPLPNGQSVRLLEDNNVYLGNQIEMPGSGRCYGVVADEAYLLVCEYGCNGEKRVLVGKGSVCPLLSLQQQYGNPPPQAEA